MTSLVAMHTLSPGRDLDRYIATVNAFPLLSAEEEQRLARRFAESGDLEAARELVLAHLRFVVHVARGYAGYGLAQGDLIQEGNVGLMKAVKRFDPDFGVRLVSFAVHWIKAEIHEFILRNWRIVKVATTKAQRKLFFNLRRAKKRLGWMSRAEVDTVARELGVEAEEVVRMEGRLAAHDTAFDPHDDDEDGSFAPARYLVDEKADPALSIAEEDFHEAAMSRLDAGFADLDERARDIIRSRWLAEEKATLHQLAERYGVSAERIRQLEQNALKRLRTTLEAA
jgi:RNA polymerase sigma-32 factor